MKAYALLITPLAKGAFFKDYLSVIRAELDFLSKAVEGSTISQVDTVTIGGLEFVTLCCAEIQLPCLLNLSFLQGVFDYSNNIPTPLSVLATYNLHEDFVYGAKYKGKTNELLTQLLLNLGLSQLASNRAQSIASLNENRSALKLLDPMCGRGTTLMWSMRYGLNSKGIEQDAKALGDVRQNLRKWCKLHRIKHSLKEGFVNKSNRKQSGKFIEFISENTSTQIICGDATQADTVLNAEKFDLIVSDLPYGIQHTTRDGRYNPIDTIIECAKRWQFCLKKDGAVVLAFNKYQPKRQVLIDALSDLGFTAVDFEAAHRMSESIVRDILILVRRP